jgi:hypothetical protein
MADQLPTPLADLAAQANAVAAAPNLPQAAPDTTSGASGILPAVVPQAGPPIAQDSTIVVTPAPAPPPQVTVVPKPPGLPSAQPAGPRGVTPPSPELMGLMANATEPPNPAGDAVDQALAADATARAVPPPAKPGDMAASGAAATAAGQAQSQALTEGGAADQQAAAAETAAREKLAKETEQKAAEQKQIRDQAAAHVQQLREKAQAAPFHKLFEGEPGNMVLAGLGILLGSASYSANHVNQAVGIIDRAIKQNFDTQQAQHAQLWKGVETAMEEGRALRSDQLDDMANFRARQAQTLDAVIAKGTELRGRAKNKEMAAALDAKNTQLAFERDKAYDEVSRLKAAQLETERHNKAEEGIQRTHAAAAMLGAKGKASADQEDKVYKLAAKAFPSYKDAQKAVKESNDVHEAIDRLKTNPSSLTSALELGGIVKLIEGRNSIAGLKMAKDAAGNVSSGFLDELSKALTGNQGQQRRQTLINELETIATSKDKATAGYRKQAESATSRLRIHAPEAVDSYLGGIFGEPRAAGASAIPPGAVMGTYKGQRGYAVPGGPFVPLAQ